MKKENKFIPLSEKIFSLSIIGKEILKVEDVKEFIEEVKKVFHMGTLYEGESIWKILDEKAGEKLIWKKK